MRSRSPLRTAIQSVQYGSIALAILSISAAGAPAENLDAMFKAFSFPDGAQQSVMAGEFVIENMRSASDRELAVGLAFKIDAEPAKIAEALLSGIAISQDSRALRFGRVSLPTDTEDLADVKLESSQVDRWRDARPGEKINLSRSEFALVNTSLGRKDGKSPSAVQRVAREVLLGRMRSYQISGLNGISSYLRSDGKTRDGGKELRVATAAARRIGLFSSGFYAVLLAYPDRLPPSFQETYFWVVEKGPDGPLVSLTHRFVVPQGDGFGTVQRQFYVTNGYNVEQALARIVPVDGGSVVLYSNRTSTDEVSGFAGGARRTIGDDLMRTQLKRLYESMASKLEGAPD